MKKALIIILSFVEFLDDTRGIISSLLSANSRIGRLRPAVKCLHSVSHGRRLVASSPAGLTSILENMRYGTTLVIQNSLLKEASFREISTGALGFLDASKHEDEVKRSVLLQLYQQAMEHSRTAA